MLEQLANFVTTHPSIQVIYLMCLLSLPFDKLIWQWNWSSLMIKSLKVWEVFLAQIV